MSMEEEGVSAGTDHHTMISSFLEIAVGQTPDTARQFLQVTDLISLAFHSIYSYDSAAPW